MNAIERKAWWKEMGELVLRYRAALADLTMLIEALEADDVAERQFIDTLAFGIEVLDAKHTHSGPLTPQ